MRQPSTYRQLHAWHTAALAGDNPPLHDGIVHCGFYKRRMVKNGPWVPVRIYCAREIDPETGDLAADEEFRIMVEGIDRGDDPADHWTYLKPISKADYDWLLDHRLRDTRYFDPTQRIDLSDAPTPPQGA